ncbi:MAG: HlyD family efflux transporter periplasmic adaptor subunit [Thermoguttaceae bacterium]
MSSYEQPIDAQLIEQTKRQIQGLVAEIAQLTKQNVAPGEFYGQFLGKVVTALAAPGGAVWTTADDGHIALQYQINLQQTNLPDNEENQKRHSRLLFKALADGEGLLVPPNSGFGEDNEVANPTEFLLVIAPLRTDLEMVGLVEIFQRADSAPNVQQGYLRFLLQGNHCLIEAVSGQDVFDKRSNTIRLLGRLATAVVATGDPIWYTGDTTDLAPQVEDAVQEYVDEAHSKMIAVLPLGRPKPDQEIDRDEREDFEPAIGALVIEQIEDSRVAPALMQRVDVVCRHSSTALANAMEHQSLFLMPLWRLIGKSRVLVKARTLPKTISISAAVLLGLLLLFVWPADFQLQGKGTLEPVDRCDVFAGADGVICEIPKGIKDGAMVHKGDLLLRLRNTDFEVNRADLEGQVITAREHVFSIQHLLSSIGLRPEEKSRLYGELAEGKEKLMSLEAQRDLYKAKMAELEIKSPIDGQVVAWDLQRLMLRPVQKGQMLLRVANPDGPWQLELHMAEDRMGHIVRAEQQAVAGPDKPLPVSYILATEPGTTRQGAIQEIQQAAEVHGEEGNTVLIKVSMNKDDVATADLRPGASVTAKVYCGRRSLGYVLFHDVIAFVQSRILFRLF